MNKLSAKIGVAGLSPLLKHSALTASSQTIAVAVSGGVDSLYSLLRLHNAGYNVLAVHARFIDNVYDPSCDLDAICRKFGINFHRLDLREEFNKSVINYFVSEHLLGRTPNPCAFCNRNMKFGLVMDRAFDLGAEHLATGHYAQITNHASYGHCLTKALDQTKDQAYFLSLVPKEKLQYLYFPLFDTHKDETYQALSELGIKIPIQKESQEICFVPNNSHIDFLAPYIQKDMSGDILIEQNGDLKKVGTHQGLWQYTEGQRRGLNIPYSEALYVIRRDLDNNSLILGTKNQALVHNCIARDLNIVVPPELWSKQVYARLRYRQKLAPVSYSLSDEQINVHFPIPQDITAIGQVLCLYDHSQTILAAGIIDKIN